MICSPSYEIDQTRLYKQDDDVTSDDFYSSPIVDRLYHIIIIIIIITTMFIDDGYVQACNGCYWHNNYRI